jgi:hypothetical protein
MASNVNKQFNEIRRINIESEFEINRIITECRGLLAALGDSRGPVQDAIRDRLADLLVRSEIRRAQILRYREDINDRQDELERQYD